MIRTKTSEPTDKNSVLANLCRFLPHDEAVVQIGATVAWPGSRDDISHGLRIGLLHLGAGCHGQFEHLSPYLVRGAIVLFEECYSDSPAYSYAVDLCAKGFLSSPIEARHWDGLGVTTYFGGTK